MRALLAFAALLPRLTAAEPAVVVSPAPGDTAVTIYGDDLALVREKRTVELPLGPSIVEFRGVSDAIVPRAAIVEGLDGIVERNFDYDLLSPYALVNEAIGQRVTLVRTNPGSGAVTRESATVVSGAQGVMLDFGGGRSEALECSGLPEGLVFEQLPPGLHAEPTLSARVHNKRAGAQTLTLVYLAHGISWQADYNLRLTPSGDRIDMEAWLTLANAGGTTFADTEAAVVAGELNRKDDGREIIALESLVDHCWAWGRRWPGFWSAPSMERQNIPSLEARTESRGVEEIIITARKREAVDVTEAQREELLDYHLYRIPWRTTVAARQSKQVRFLEKRGVRVERFYRFSADDYYEDEENDPEPAGIFLRFHNRKQDGLGEPLPEGVMHVTQAGPTGEPVFIGEAEIANTAENLPVELEIGGSIDVQDRMTVTDYRERVRLLTVLRGEPEMRSSAHLQHEITNAKPVPVIVELRQFGYRVRISNSSHPWKKDRGYPVWRFEVPANGSVVVDYRVRMDE